jgi:ABC-type dipeptide/oligopeptide/nickel transport system permease component
VTTKGSGAPGAEAARAELVRLGGAALPYVLPRLDALPPARRLALALALAPVARRMGNTSPEIDDPARAVAFWTRFWDDRGIEFRHASVRSAVSRLTRSGGATRAADLIELDTFVLDDVLGALEVPGDDDGVARARSLVDVAAHVSGRDDRIAPGGDLAAARACVERWQAYWSVYRGDFTDDTGLARVAAMVLETRYGKWAYEAVTHRFGRTAAGLSLDRPGDAPSPTVLDALEVRVPVTVAIVFGAIALAYAVAVPLGAIGAAYRGRRVDVAVMLTLLVLYATPTAVIAVMARAAGAGSVLSGIFILAPALAAAPIAQQRAALGLSLSQDYARAATARGASRARVIVVHALRNALVPVVTLATLEGPMALGGAFVVERVLSLRGIGEVTILAVQQRDIAWLMAISLSAALIAAVFVVAADLAHVVVDPRIAGAVLGRKGRP